MNVASRLLIKSANGIPRLTEAASRGKSHLSEAQHFEEDDSPLRTLRPCWTAFLNSLQAILFQIAISNVVRVQYRECVCLHTTRGFTRKWGFSRWVLLLGVAIVLFAGTGRAESCNLSSVHGDMTFPVERIPSDWTCQLKTIIESNTTVTRVGPIRVAMSEPLYRYLLGDPPIAAALIRRLGLGSYHSQAWGEDRFWGDDGEGTKGFVQLVYQDAESRMYLLDGSHESRVLPHITGKAVVFLQMAVVRDQQGNEDMDSTIVAYTKLDNRFLSGLVSLLHPLIRGMVKSRLQKGIETVHRLGLVIRQQPSRVLREAEQDPPLPEQHVVFLKKVLGSPLNSGRSLSPVSTTP